MNKQAGNCLKKKVCNVHVAHDPLALLVTQAHHAENKRGHKKPRHEQHKHRLEVWIPNLQLLGRRQPHHRHGGHVGVAVRAQHRDQVEGPADPENRGDYDRKMSGDFDGRQ